MTASTATPSRDLPGFPGFIATPLPWGSTLISGHGLWLVIDHTEGSVTGLRALWNLRRAAGNR